MSSFDYDEEDDRPRRSRRYQPRQAGHGGSAFATMFGGSLGCMAAVVLVMVLSCGGLLFLAGLGSKDRPEPPATEKRR